MIGDPPPTVIQVSSVSYSYEREEVIHDINWNIPPGITALMGPNGAGKTTLLKLLSGVLTPSSGTIHYSGSGIPEKAFDKLRIGYLPQEYKFVMSMHVQETVCHAAWSAGIKRSEVAEYTRDALSAVYLTDRAHFRVKALSGGQRQRLAIACAIVARPRLLLLDEPTAGLDPLQRKNLRDLLVSVGKHLPIVLSTHLVDDVVQLATSVLVLQGGNILYAGSKLKFMGNKSLEEAYIDSVTGSSL